MTQPVVSALIAFAAALTLGPITIQWLHRMKYGQQVRTDGPKSHMKKQGVPTMGGIIIIVSLFIAVLLFGSRHEMVWYILFTTGGYALIGLLDDVLSIVAKRSLGLKARHKLIAQIVIALVPALYMMSQHDTRVAIPFTDMFFTLPAVVYVVFSVFLIVGFGNAVNITDGLDGLAAVSTGISAIVYAVVCALLGMDELIPFAAALSGACFGFAWFNAHPAQVFMGDTGSLALGAALGSLAVLTRTHLLILIIGGLFVIETLSVIIQVVYFRLTNGKRILRMAPIHHHFELIGWPESKVVVRFWFVALLCGVIGIIAL